MKKLILSLLLAAAMLSTKAQVRDLNEYNIFMRQGKEKSDSAFYFAAYKKFRNAEHWAGNDQKRKKAAADAQEIAIANIQKQKELADSLKLISEINLSKANKALAKAEEMQTLVETAMFDKAVKERNKEWKGYVNMESSERKPILESIDSLDLSSSGLLRIPKEVNECPNLKHINLLGNKNINWKASDSTLTKLNPETEIYISIYNLDSLNQKHWKKVTGLEILEERMSKMPGSILEQTQLIYLSLNWNNFDSLPKQIGNLSKLTSLYLANNQLTTLPKEIGDLSKLTSLYLANNKLIV